MAATDPIGGEAPSALVLEGGAPALAAARSLGRAGWRVLAPLGTRAAASRYCATAVDLPGAEQAPAAFADAVASCVTHEHVDVVIPTRDASMTLLWAGPDLPGAKIVGGDRQHTVLLTDKARAIRAAESAGFPAPAWVDPRDERDAVRAAREIGFPCVVKPRRSYVPSCGRLRQVRHSFASNEADLRAKLRPGPDGELPLLQAYVPGRSLSVGAVLAGGRVLARVARETMSFHPIPGGTSVWKRTVPPDDVGVGAALDLLQRLGYDGLAEVEYQVDAGGVPRFMEVGVRVFGWLPLAILAGVDLPLIAARALIGESPGPVPEYAVGAEMRWPGGELKRLRDALGRSPRLPPGVSRADVIAGAWPPWRPGMRYDGVDLRDLRPLLPAGSSTWLHGKGG